MYSGPLSTRMVPGFPRHSMWRRARKRSSGPFSRRRVQAANDPFCGQREVNLDAQAFAVEAVQHIQQPKGTAVAEAIRHEVHRPGHIGRIWHCQDIRLLPFQPLSGLDPQVEFQRAVDPIDAFVVPRVALDVTQMQETQAKTPSLSRICQPRQQIGDHRVLVLQLRAVTITGLADPEGPARQRDANAPSLHRRFGHLTAPRWPIYFFQELPSANRSACSGPHTSASADGSLLQWLSSG